MGYEVRITRKAQWFEPHGPRISADEWAAYVDTHSECQWVPRAARNHEPDDVVLVIDSLGLEVGRLWWWRDGSVTTKNPSPELMSYMIEIANALDARLMGDDSETYRDANSPHTSRAPYFNANNVTNEWEEPPDGHEEAYRKQQRERWAANEATATQDRLQEEVISTNKTRNLQKKAALYNRLSTGAAILFLLIVAIKAFS